MVGNSPEIPKSRGVGRSPIENASPRTPKSAVSGARDPGNTPQDPPDSRKYPPDHPEYPPDPPNPEEVGAREAVRGPGEGRNRLPDPPRNDPKTLHPRIPQNHGFGPPQNPPIWPLLGGQNHPKSPISGIPNPVGGSVYTTIVKKKIPVPNWGIIKYPRILLFFPDPPQGGSPQNLPKAAKTSFSRILEALPPLRPPQTPQNTLQTSPDPGNPRLGEGAGGDLNPLLQLWEDPRGLGNTGWGVVGD